jgi:predicted NodU family carbamoyl transferase
MPITVGIHDGYNAPAAVIRDRRIELALQEERLTRLKNQADAPYEVLNRDWDYNTRPHEVLEQHNPDYYRLLKEYEGRTGERIVLNTSFHLPGEPIVYRAGDAVDAFVRSGLERMALANWWVEKL